MADDKGTRGVVTEKLLNFIFGTLLAGLVSTSFTYKSWREQTRLELAKERLTEATATLNKASQLIATRVFRSYDLVMNMSRDDDAAFAKRAEALQTAIEQWNLAFPDLLQQFQFSLEVDENGRIAPYREIHSRALEKLDCAEAFRAGASPPPPDWSSPTWLLAGLNHCFIAADVRLGAPKLRKEPTSDERARRIDALETQIDALKTHGEEVRVAGKKAIARLRDGAEARGFLEFLRSW